MPRLLSPRKGRSRRSGIAEITCQFRQPETLV
ncbi:unnamed protein product [Penicillium roqueforti FM164]|uniref:Genomic scaffold, ProqFM164S01 n=1 Tax=Penicillium roqueforti (strain FM164) TaxID=1365484 RepID=W6PWF2_PENRF|nr:unnamed protein product [Penicillium roqueforti FM164]